MNSFIISLLIHILIKAVPELNPEHGRIEQPVRLVLHATAHYVFHILFPRKSAIIRPKKVLDEHLMINIIEIIV